jgi:antitoxin ParD1/3/4
MMMFEFVLQSASRVYNVNMRSTMNVSLPPALKKWVDQQVKAGGFGTASEYLRDMLRRAREREARRSLDALLLDGVRSPMIDLDEAEWASLKKSVRASARKSAGRSTARRK